VAQALYKIISLKAVFNLGLSEQLKINFPIITQIDRPKVENQKIKDPN
jgi:hypothetical protein